MCILPQPFNGETELMSGFLYLVLSFTMQHVCCWDSLNSQDDITRAQVGSRCLTARSDLDGSQQTR